MNDKKSFLDHVKDSLRENNWLYKLLSRHKDRTPNSETLEAFDDVENDKDLNRMTFDEFKDSLDAE